MAVNETDFSPNGFRGSNLICPATQSGLSPANMPQRCFALRQPAEIFARGRKRPKAASAYFAQ
jgi:hypothetical protein